MVSSLKKEFLELLEKDEEFRYAIAGRIGILEVLKRLDKLEEGQKKLWEGQKKLWEGQKKLWEGQRKLWEGQKKLWENQNKLWLEVKALRENHERLEKVVKGLVNSVRALGSAVGTTLDHYTAAFIEDQLVIMGVPREKVKVKVNRTIRYREKEREIDVFNKDPLVVGEVTTSLKTLREAKTELEKLLKDIGFLEEIYGVKVFMGFLAVASAPKEVLNFLKKEAERRNIKLIYGRALEQKFIS